MWVCCHLDQANKVPVLRASGNQGLAPFLAANMPRGNDVYAGLETLETETLRKPSKMSTEKLHTAIKWQETEMSRVEVHRVRMQTRYWKLVHELNKRVNEETSDVKPLVEKGNRRAWKSVEVAECGYKRCARATSETAR